MTIASETAVAGKTAPNTDFSAAGPTMLPLALSREIFPMPLRADAEYQERSSQVVDHSGLADV